jgi:hypothetical protein
MQIGHHLVANLSVTDDFRAGRLGRGVRGWPDPVGPEYIFDDGLTLYSLFRAWYRGLGNACQSDDKEDGK